MRSINRMIFMLGVLGWVCHAFSAAPAVAVEAERRIDPGRSPATQAPERWRLNAAGQLEILHDPLGNGRDLIRKIHTVLLVDREPKMCRAGDPRYIWFFTEALLIESRPLSPPSPATFNGERP